MDTLQFIPPFSYSYQCGSTLLTTYIPVYMYLISLQIITTILQFGILFTSNFMNYPSWLRNKFVGISSPNYWNSSLLSTPSSSTSPPSPLSSIQMLRPYEIFSFTMNNLLLFLSFGLCSPVLCWYITLSICLHLSSWLILIGRFIICSSDSVEQKTNTRNEFVILLNEQVQGIQSSIVVCKWPIISTSCLFITLLCWDMAGDAVGWERAMWVPLTGIAIFLLILLWDQCLTHGLLEKYSSWFAFISIVSRGSSPSTSLLPPSAPLDSSNSHNVEFITSSLHPSSP